jgi:hypothetical protein
MARNRSILACVAMGLLTAACSRDPGAAPPTDGAPQSPDGRRTSVPGQAMDRAEDLQKEIAAYNQQVEDAADQGANVAPPKKPVSAPKN